MPTKIEWAGETKNPIKIKVAGETKGYHCTKLSEGCLHCYAEKMNLNDGYYPWANGLPYDGRKYEYVLDKKVLAQIARWRKPRRVFIQSMSDPFHPDIPEELIVQLLHFLAAHERHVFMLLTKRPGRMKEVWAKAFPNGGPRHIWAGASAENQKRADERIPDLIDTCAPITFLSLEPLLGQIDLGCALDGDFLSHEEAPHIVPKGRNAYWCPYISGVIVGGETGPGARPMHPDWPRSIRDECQAAEVPFFFKQWGEWWPYSQMPGAPSIEKEAAAHKHAELVLQIPDSKGNTTLASVFHFGKKAAGRLLDGREWNELPKI